MRMVLLRYLPTARRQYRVVAMAVMATVIMATVMHHYIVEMELAIMVKVAALVSMIAGRAFTTI